MGMVWAPGSTTVTGKVTAGAGKQCCGGYFDCLSFLALLKMGVPLQSSVNCRDFSSFQMSTPEDNAVSLFWDPNHCIRHA